MESILEAAAELPQYLQGNQYRVRKVIQLHGLYTAVQGVAFGIHTLQNNGRI